MSQHFSEEIIDRYNTNNTK